MCINCRRLFKYIYGPDLCPDCIRMAEQDKAEQNGRETTPGSNHISNTQDIRSTLHNKTAASTLRALVKEEEAKFEQVSNYIISNPRASVAQIAEANDIPPTKLFEWIRDDRLEFSEDSQYAWFNCEKCGAKIKSGRICSRCKIK